MIHTLAALLLMKEAGLLFCEHGLRASNEVINMIFEVLYLVQ